MPGINIKLFGFQMTSAPSCRLVVFGGCTQASKRLSEVYSLDLASWEWQKHTTEEQVVPHPSPIHSEEVLTETRQSQSGTALLIFAAIGQ